MHNKADRLVKGSGPKKDPRYQHHAKRRDYLQTLPDGGKASPCCHRIDVASMGLREDKRHVIQSVQKPPGDKIPIGSMPKTADGKSQQNIP
jgi:hypothetical protein